MDSRYSKNSDYIEPKKKAKRKSKSKRKKAPKFEPLFDKEFPAENKIVNEPSSKGFVYI